MTRWVEDVTMVAPEGHAWVKPAPEPCPNCPCCWAPLCEMARERGGACHWYSTGGDLDIANCPCWKGNRS